MGLWDKLFNKTPVLKGYVSEEHYPMYENAKGETVEMSPEQYQRVQGENVPNDVATTYGIATLPFATMSAPIGVGSALGNAVLNSAFGGGVYGGINGAINSINNGENPLLGTAKGFGEGALVGGALGVPAHYTGELLNYGVKKALPYIRNVRNGGGLFDKIVGNIAFDESFNPEIEKLAKDYFGTTTNRREAGYILNDGSMLDLSGKNFGGSAGRRSLDHREIVDAFLDNPNNINNLDIGFDEFIDNGAVRYMPESNSFFLSRMPSEAQINRIKDLLDYERGKSQFELVPNVKDWGNNNTFRRDYKLWSDSNKIIDDVRTYFNGGKVSNFKDYY